MSIVLRNQPTPRNKFQGYEVSCWVGGQRHVARFAPVNSGLDIAWEHAHLRARLQLAQWEAQREWIKYQRTVTRPHGKTVAAKALPFRGITLDFKTRESGDRVACFVVHSDGEEAPMRLFHFLRQSYSDAWRSAVDCWRSRREVTDADYERIRQDIPDPDRFKRLRHWMCENGEDVPVEALGPVFAERREALRRQREKDMAHQAKKSGTKVSPQPHVVTDIESWFQKELAT